MPFVQGKPILPEEIAKLNKRGVIELPNFEIIL